MRYPPHLLDDIRARLPVSQVVGRKVALKKKGRELAGLSPFKVEKTPSFFVNDQKGFYHCFASGEHGDIFKFLMKTEGLSFPEAVERLAAEAGVAMPKPEAREVERDDQRQRLLGLVETAARYFQDCLTGAVGREARAYIEKRGLHRNAWGTYRLGYAPSSRSALKEHLSKAGYTLEEMIASGMLIGGADIPVAYDRFRHRVIFPIEDLRGRVIAFGGRALDPDAPAKYLNSPETPLFHKGHNLFNSHRARPAAHASGRLIVVEGYMDVLALAEAGFRETVAPLGTALTEEQVQLLWRLSPEPILFFDGDSAGRKAAFRAVDTVLAQLKPGFSARFAFLDGGLDPDDLVRQQGPDAVSTVLSRSRALFDVLWEREQSLEAVDTPERRAAFEVRLKGLITRIPDATVRNQYANEARHTLWAWNQSVIRQTAGTSRDKAQRPVGRQRNTETGDWRLRARAQMRPGGTRPQKLAVGAPSRELVGRGEPLPAREALILLTIINHPWLVDEHAETFAALNLTAPALSRLRDAILSATTMDNSLDSARLRSQLTGLGVGKVVELVERALTHRCDKFAEAQSERAEVEAGWRHTLALHERQVGLKQALKVAEQAWHQDRSDEAYARIRELQGQLGELQSLEAHEPGAGGGGLSG